MEQGCRLLLHLMSMAWIITAAYANEVFDSAKNCRPPSISSEGSMFGNFIANNDELIIPCVANGSGTMEYKWLKDGAPIVFTDKITLEGQGNLRLNNPEPKDVGYYQCSVTNNCGTALTRVTKVSQKKLDPFPPVKKPEEKKAVEGSSLVLYCDTPYSHPAPIVSWVLLNSPNVIRKMVTSSSRKGSKAVNSVELDNRVTNDDKGNLYITNVRKEDEKGGATYVCDAYNEETRSGAKGSDKIIKVIGTGSGEDALKRPPDLMWRTGDQIIAIEEDSLSLKCIFSGNPVPEVSWQRLDGRLDKDHHFQSNMELFIGQVLPSDEGTYECTGKNVHGSKSYTFNVKVESAPQWQDQPLDVTIGPGEDTEIKCRARGTPEPKIEWFINGKPIEGLKPDKWELDGHILRFEKLEMSDSKVIQCNASNSHGYIFADVYLFVEAMAPVIERGPLELVIVAEERELRITCQMKGKPKPNVVWYKGGQPLEHERYQYQDNGDLIIADTTKKDSGNYRCKVTNRFGSTWEEGEVQVREKTQILSQPTDRNVTFQSDAIFMCGAKTDPLETGNLKYKWLKNDIPLKASNDVIIEKGKLTIKDTSSKDSGNYTCIAHNGLDSDSASAILRVKAMPDPPKDINVPVCEGKQATVTWYFDDSMTNYQPLEKFVVESLTKFHGDEESEGRWQHAADVPVAIPIAGTTTTTTYKASLTLSPYTRYKFRVRAVNALGSSAPSQPSYSLCDTPRSLPEKNPENVHTDEQYTGYLVVKWDPLNKIDLNGPNFTYLVEVQRQGDEYDVEYEVDDFNVGEKWIEVDDIYYPYYLRVWSVNSVGKYMDFPKTKVGYSGEGVPLVTPGNFELDPAVNVTATSATFRWDAVNTSVEAMQGKFTGYKIRYWKVGEKDTTMRSFIVEQEKRSRIGRKRRQNGDDDDGKVRGTVANLPSYAELEADVVALNKNFESNSSNVIVIRTPEGVPGPVAYFEAINRGSHHFLLHWAHPKEANGIITHYQISYRKIEKLDFFPMETAFDNLSPETVRVMLNELEPNSQYRIYIKAFTKIGAGKEYFIDVRTNPDDIDMALPVIQHVEAGETGANITFEILSPSKSSRYGQLYKIEYKKKKSDKWEISDEPVGQGLMWGFLDHLEPNEQYQVRVLALAHDGGDTRPSEAYTFKTAGFGAKQGTFLTAAWFIGMMVAIAILLLLLIIVCIIKRNRGDNYPVQEKERLRGNCDDNQDHFNGFGKPDENGLGASSSFDQDVEKVPLDAESDSLDYGDDDASKFNEDGSFIGQYGRGEKSNDPGNSSSIV